MRNGRKDGGGMPEAAAPRPNWMAKYLGAGLQFGLAIALFTLAGAWLDRRVGATPLFTIIGLFVGGVGGFISLYSRVMKDVKREEENDG